MKQRQNNLYNRLFIETGVMLHADTSQGMQRARRLKKDKHGLNLPAGSGKSTDGFKTAFRRLLNGF
jgi:hypothetical protein